MYIKILFNYIFGYVNVEITGYFVEKFINICKSKGVFLWGIRRTKATIAYANVSVKNFKEMIKIAKKNKCIVKIKNKRGLPFIFNKYKKRKIFIGVLTILCLLIVLLSNFIWNIEIIGNEKINEEELINQLKECGLNKGMIKSKINTKEIINEIRLKNEDIAWVGLDIKGTNIKIKVVEADKKPDLIDEEDYCNIVANKPGIIVKINARKRYTLS